ncbi:odorant receptor 129-1 [Scleropages formosus]|uniref:odorant receptor 129-1 n=1 Tax=Scleropages formosus TaxID=113540 RepID=UPI0008791087|nr:odorant receptor 131-2-like [Scleropages formosus]
MQNETVLGNTTSNRSLMVIMKICFVSPFFGVFLYCIVVMLHTFILHRQFWDSSRYILFVYMLINDTLQLLSSVLLFLFVMADLHISFACCAPLLFLSTATFQNTPLILATMSLERYVAIFYPLQQPAAWHADHIWVIILSLWLISCIIPTVDFSLGGLRISIDVLLTPVLCKTQALNSSPVQMLFKVILNGLFFTLVAIIILFTYIRILLETRKMRQDRASVSKALHTVLLHGLQLLLCMMSLTHPITEGLIIQHMGWLQDNISFFNYFCFVLLPRFLSPLIYGLRDDMLRKKIRGAIFCCSTKGAQQNEYPKEVDS